MNPRIGIASTSLEQRDLIPAAFRQPVRKHAPGRTGTNDDKIEFHPNTPTIMISKNVSF
jgi:hypothetical protein